MSAMPEQKLWVGILKLFIDDYRYREISSEQATLWLETEWADHVCEMAGTTSEYIYRKIFIDKTVIQLDKKKGQNKNRRKRNEQSEKNHSESGENEPTDSQPEPNSDGRTTVSIGAQESEFSQDLSEPLSSNQALIKAGIRGEISLSF